MFIADDESAKDIGDAFAVGNKKQQHFRVTGKRLYKNRHAAVKAAKEAHGDL